MKTLKKILIAAALILTFTLSASAEFHFYTAPLVSYYPRYFFWSSYNSIFYPDLSFAACIAKYNIPMSPKYHASYVRLASNNDHSIICYYKDEFSDSCFVVFKTRDTAKIFTVNDFSKYLPRASFCKGMNSFIGYPIDSTQVMFCVSAYNMLKNAVINQGNIFFYNPQTDSISLAPKVYFPEFNDSAIAIVPAGASFSYGSDGCLYGKICSYKYGKLKENGDTTVSESCETCHYFVCYNPQQRAFKVLAKCENLLLCSAKGDPVDNAGDNYFPNFGAMPHGCYWITMNYDDYYKVFHDTLHVYDNQKDTSYLYNLDDYFSLPIHNSLCNAQVGNDGTIIMQTSRNILLVRNPEGKIKEELRLYSNFSDTCTDWCRFTSDNSGNIYGAFNGSRTYLRLTPDGELSEFTTGPEGADSAHLYGFAMPYSPSIYEDGTNKFLFGVVQRKTSGKYQLVFDLNYNEKQSGVAASDLPTGILHLDNIYPNPASGIINISISASDDTALAVRSVKIYNQLGVEAADLTGKLIFHGGKYSLTYDISGLPAGMYFVAVRNSMCRVSRVFVIK